jgi:hypothetical protein
MYDGGKIITGLVIFLCLATFPFWYNQARGEAASAMPKLKLPTEAKECVAPTDYMRSSHMQMLNEWRTQVVRDNNRLYVAPNGKEYMMSLTNTCLKCHSDRQQFCEQCHGYVGVSVYCWDCHVTPKENT